MLSAETADETPTPLTREQWNKMHYASLTFANEARMKTEELARRAYYWNRGERAPV